MRGSARRVRAGGADGGIARFDVEMQVIATVAVVAQLRLGRPGQREQRQRGPPEYPKRMPIACRFSSPTEAPSPAA